MSERALHGEARIHASAKGLLAVVFLLLATLASAEDWSEAYWNGLQALKRRDGPQAVASLERAIALRPEAGRDVPLSSGRRVDYFPYVRLAQARLLTGDLEGAREALRRSETSQEPPGERLKTEAVLSMVERRRSGASVPARPGFPPPAALPIPDATPDARLAATPEPPPTTQAPAEPTPEAPSLIVFSDPPGAAVYLDDETLGSTDPTSGRLVRSGVASGAHRVRLSLAGRTELTAAVQVAPEGPTTFRGALLKPAPSRAPFAVLLAAAGLSGLYFLSRRKRPVPENTPPPRRRTAPSMAEAPTRALATKVSASEEVFGAFRLVSPLGRGGMASVFKAERGRDVCALKRPLTAFLEDPEFLERFLREAEIGRTLHHPNIIRIFERGDVGGVPYFTMELVAGETLQSKLKRGGALAPREAARIVSQVAEALDYAHLKGVIHRDLKPSNIMILEDGTVKVMDYGIARALRFQGLTVTGAFLGTPDYVAPETAEGKGADARSDLYSLGIVFYEALTGRRPFTGDTPFATLKKHCTEPPTPPRALTPSVPLELEAIVLKLLLKDPAERYAGAEELLIELRQYLNRAA